eukprot:973970-Amphidinium_carterae.1
MSTTACQKRNERSDILRFCWFCRGQKGVVVVTPREGFCISFVHFKPSACFLACCIEVRSSKTPQHAVGSSKLRSRRQCRDIQTNSQLAI